MSEGEMVVVNIFPQFDQDQLYILPIKMPRYLLIIIYSFIYIFFTDAQLLIFVNNKTLLKLINLNYYSSVIVQICHNEKCSCFSNKSIQTCQCLYYRYSENANVYFTNYMRNSPEDRHFVINWLIQANLITDPA